MPTLRLFRTIRPAAPVLVAAAVFTAASGFVHLREWLDTYRDVPASAPGSFVVRLGFPINAGVSLVLALALVFCALRATRLAPLIIGGAILFQASSLLTLILTRTGSVLGWSEPVWTRGANESRAVEIGALVALAAVVAIAAARRRRGARSAAGPGLTRLVAGPVPSPA